MIKRIKELVKYKDMISSLIKRDLRGRYQKSALGMLWALLNPLFQVLMYTIVFTFIFKHNIKNYPVHLIAALIPWVFFTESVASGVICVVGNSDMIKKIYFPREVLVVSTVISKFVNMLFSFVIVFIFVIISGIPLNLLAILCLPLVMFIELVFTLGFVLLVSSICVYFRDTEYIIRIIIEAWVWLTPVMYSIDIVKGIMYKLMFLNPFTPIVLAYRDILYYSKLPNINQLGIAFVVAITMLIIGELIFKKLEPYFAEEL